VVDLAWVREAGGYFEFRHTAPAGVHDHRRRPVAADQSVALYNTGARRYLVYQKRGDALAEVEWSRTPAYEWQLRDQSPNAGRVEFALFNKRVNKYLVRTAVSDGIGLGWFNENPRVPQSFSVALNAQPVNQGWVPYQGNFGQNTKGSLLSVQNASQNATLLFVKPGKSTNDCSDPKATVPVAGRATMTPDQMKTLYGSATPRLAINFLACLVTPTTQSLSLVFINLTYNLD
jgi:hypothetical protein